MMISIALLTGVCLGYIARVFVERLNKPTTLDDLWDEQEWETLKRKVSEAFDRLESGTVDKPKKKVTKPKTDVRSGKKPE